MLSALLRGSGFVVVCAAAAPDAAPTVAAVPVAAAVTVELRFASVGSAGPALGSCGQKGDSILQLGGPGSASVFSPCCGTAAAPAMSTHKCSDVWLLHLHPRPLFGRAEMAGCRLVFCRPGVSQHFCSQRCASHQGRRNRRVELALEGRRSASSPQLGRGDPWHTSSPLPGRGNATLHVSQGSISSPRSGRENP